MKYKCMYSPKWQAGTEQEKTILQFEKKSQFPSVLDITCKDFSLLPLLCEISGDDTKWRQADHQNCEPINDGGKLLHNVPAGGADASQAGDPVQS